MFFFMYLCSRIVICREYSNNWEGSLLHLISIRKIVPYLFQFEIRKSLKVVDQSMKVFSSEIVILFHYFYVNVQGSWLSFVWSIKSFSLLLNSRLISLVSFLSYQVAFLMMSLHTMSIISLFLHSVSPVYPSAGTLPPPSLCFQTCPLYLYEVHIFHAFPILYFKRYFLSVLMVSLILNF